MKVLEVIEAAVDDGFPAIISWLFSFDFVEFIAGEVALFDELWFFDIDHSILKKLCIVFRVYGIFYAVFFIDEIDEIVGLELYREIFFIVALLFFGLAVLGGGVRFVLAWLFFDEFVFLVMHWLYYSSELSSSSYQSQSIFYLCLQRKSQNIN